jgi:hypothetical protein
MDTSPAAATGVAAAPAALGPSAAAQERARDTLGKEMRESVLLLGLSFGVTAGLTFALQAAVALVG